MGCYFMLSLVMLSLADTCGAPSSARGGAQARVVFVRHGQSQFNAARRFTGWTDIDLTEAGREEARFGGEQLLSQHLSFDCAFTSELRRAQETLAILLHSSQQHDVPTMRSWRLNERHYGALQGRSKQQCVDEYGIEQVRLWRNSFDTPPPLVSTHSPAFPGNDPKYSSVHPSLLPRGECLRGTLKRCLPFWTEHVVPQLHLGRSVLIAAHGHSIRALLKHLEGISDHEISRLSIPNGVPLVYNLDKHLEPIRSSPAPHEDMACDSSPSLRGYFLGEAEKIRAADWMLEPKTR